MKKYLFLLFGILSLSACNSMDFGQRDEKMETKANQANLKDLKSDMDENDQHKLSRRLEALGVGESDFWQNSITSTIYSVTPTRNFSSSNYSYCRYFRLVVTKGDNRQLVYGSACRQENGSWELE